MVADKPVFRPEAAEWWINNIRQHRERLRLTGNFANEQQRREALDFADQDRLVAQERDRLTRERSGR